MPFALMGTPEASDTLAVVPHFIGIKFFFIAHNR
jgi:hypothetical protein